MTGNDGPSPDRLFQDLTTAWETALEEKRQREVILGGFAAYCYFHELNEKTFETASLIYVQKAIAELLEDVLPRQHLDRSQRNCSFCGRTEPQVRLAAGANGFICDSCVKALGNVFNNKD